MKAMKGIVKYQDKGYSFGSWLYRIALNEISTHYKKKNKILKVDESFLSTLTEDIEEKDEVEVLAGLHHPVRLGGLGQR